MKRKAFIVSLIIIFIIGVCTCLTLLQKCNMLNVTKIELVQNDEWEYSVDMWSKTATLTKYMGGQVNIEVPTTIKIEETEYTVTTIGESLFAGHQNIESIKIPESVTKVEDNAFARMYKFK